MQRTGRKPGGTNRALQVIDQDQLTDKFINKNFIIRFYPNTPERKHDDYLIRAKKMRELLGEELFIKTMQRTYRDQEHNATQERFDHYFRRGWRITLKPI
jgi:DNA polymerase IIIc chi subunit